MDSGLTPVNRTRHYDECAPRMPWVPLPMQARIAGVGVDARAGNAAAALRFRNLYCE
jgi:hypothetical protein